MIVDKLTGLISHCEYKNSPNWNERPDPNRIDLLVIHGISLPPGEFGGPFVHDLFMNMLDPTLHPYFQEIADHKVSSHLFIQRDGTLWQFVPFHKRAWHAGTSEFDGCPGCNDYSIGIELEGTDTLAYTLAQYDTLVEVSHAIMAAYPAISLDRIVGHCDIAPERKTDPGPAFDWNAYKQRLR